MAIDLRKTVRERIVDLFQSAVGSAFKLTVADINFSLPVPDNTTTRNTKIVVTPVSNTRFFAKRTLFMNRLDLDQCFDVEDLLDPGLETFATTHDALDAILEQFDIKFEPEDLQDLPIVDGVITLTATTTSLGWLNTTTLSLGIPVADTGFILDDGSDFQLDDEVEFLFALDDE